MTAPATASTLAAQTVIETSRAVSISMNAPHTPVARWGPDYILVASIIGNGHGFVIWWAGPDLNWLFSEILLGHDSSQAPVFLRIVQIRL